MHTFEALSQRRSIRKFKETPLTDEAILKVLQAATLAPSGKNRQPWHFYVVKGAQREKMLQAMHSGIEKNKARGKSPGSSEHSARSMGRAPVTIFIFNPYAKKSKKGRPFPDYLMDVVDVQSVGAAIHNMHLAAQELGIGALWICDVFYAYDELCAWLGESHQMIAAVSLGYADEAPPARPRKSAEEVTTWL